MIPKIAAPMPFVGSDLSEPSCSGSSIHKRWAKRFLPEENLPGAYPYTAGVLPYRREGEDPTRMFAGEGTPERTNRRFHYLCVDAKGARLSTVFDSVTLYFDAPAPRPDIFG